MKRTYLLFSALGLNLALVLMSMTPTPASANETKVVTSDSAKTWKDAEANCEKLTKDNLKWRLPKDSEFLVVLLALDKKDSALISFANPSDLSKNVYMMWVQGDDDAQTKKIKDKNTVLECMVDGEGTDTRAFDVVSDLKTFEDEITSAEKMPTKDGPSPDEMAAAKNWVKAIKSGLTTICISGE